jgi:hypothetical protein
MRIPLLLVLLFAGFYSYSQRLENIRAEAVNGGERVIITYDITSATSDQKYNVSVYGSHNNYSAPLNQVSGDVTNVIPGTNKRIEWNARAEMVDYSGDITFELRADLVAATLTVRTPSGVKRGKTATITYEGVTQGQNVKLELIKSGVVVQQVGTTSDPSTYKWTVPADVNKASDYQIRLTAGSRTATSGSFAIRSKSRALIYIIPAVVVTGVVVFLATKPKKNPVHDLPTPPEPVDQ